MNIRKLEDLTKEELIELIKHEREAYAHVELDRGEALEPTCRARQYSDQMYCAQCGNTWDINDPHPPLCKK